MQVYDIPNCSALDKGRAWQALYHLERVGGRAWAQDLPAALLQVHLHLHLHLHLHPGEKFQPQAPICLVETY